MREHQELVFISVGGMVQRTSAGGISQQGRSATGVRVMNLKDDDIVSAVALVVDTGEADDLPAAEDRLPFDDSQGPEAPHQNDPVEEPGESDAAEDAAEEPGESDGKE